MTVTPLAGHLLFALAWFVFGAGHSLLAGDGAKGRLGFLGPFYRLTYNLFAALHMGLVWAVGGWVFANAGGFVRAPWLDGALTGAYFLGWLVFLVALRGYDLGRLAGTRQVRDHFRGVVEPEDEPLRIDGLHRYLRHPLYAGALLILWGRVDGTFELATAVWGSLYLLAGTWFEERRLVRLHGDAYTDYRRRVPAFLPWKGGAR